MIRHFPIIKGSWKLVEKEPNMVIRSTGDDSCIITTWQSDVMDTYDFYKNAIVTIKADIINSNELDLELEYDPKMLKKFVREENLLSKILFMYQNTTE